ncbi:hypothetical protein HAHE_37160 [Haloferula helveola]|uniref:Dystroglycan-type cadherin-like domain-containing protein n=1 Tax=Haloferula helveola TaxID=490095 RepID=A0ABM7RDR8_9BACT|nr:hypothetical protein HAHE_37160 [Haloferula helveola]
MRLILPAVLASVFALPVSRAEQPNVLFIAVDDLVPTLGCYGDPVALTPEIDGLASQGMTFLNHHCNWTVCGPSRAALTTSLMPEETGVMGFKAIRHPDFLPDVITLPQHFKNEGYETACTGKFHDPRTVGDTGSALDANDQFPDGANIDDPLSWSIAYVKAASGYSPSGKPAVDDSDTEPFANYGDHHIKEEGLALIDTLSSGSKPFFLAVGFKKPHLGFYAPRQFWDLYDRSSMPLAPFSAHPAGESTFTGATLDFHSELQGYTPYDTSWPPSEAQQRELVHGYYACVSMVDALVGELIDKLAVTADPVQAGKNLDETTIIVLWGDHGFHLGDHGRWGKHSAMEEATRCPLIIYDPRDPKAPGTNSTATPVNTIDIYPTLCEMTGLPIPEQPSSNTVTTGRPLRGRSLVPVLDGSREAVHHGAITHFNNGGRYGYAYRTERFRYIEWVDGSGNVDGVDLYDYVDDPLETRNLAADDAYAAIVYQLSRSMRAETTTNGAERLNLAAPSTTGDGAFLPDVSIDLVGSGMVELAWPDSGGVSYRVLGDDDLVDPWTDDANDVPASPAELAATAARRFFRITFDDNVPPVFLSDPVLKADATPDAAYTGSLAGDVSDPGDTLTFTKLDGPAWLSIGSDGALTGTPAVGDLGAGWFTVEVSDTAGASAFAKVQISVTNETVPPSATVLEHWEFEDVAGTQFTGLANSAGSASFSGNKDQVQTDGAGNLVFGVGADASDNVFRNATLTVPGQTTGVFEMEWTYPSATIEGGDATGANVGFGFRDAGGTDLFLVRLQRQNSELRLQHRVGTSNTDLEDFNATTIADLRVRVVADLDADTFDVYWQLGAGPEQSSTGIAMSATGLNFDEVRMTANTNTTDWGATDSVSVGELKVSELP